MKRISCYKKCSTGDSGSEAAEEALDYDRLPPKPLAAKAAESVIVAAMTEEQRQLEKEIQRKQLEDIYQVMLEHRDKFGDTSIDQVVDQMGLYR